MALALMVGATASKLYTRTPDGPVLVAVADLDNQTGDPQVEGLSNLLITSLDQWPNLRILPRDRIKSIAREVASERSRIDCTVALVAAQRALEAANLAAPVPVAGAVVFCGQTERIGDGYSVRLEALEHGSPRFVLTESSSDRNGLSAVVDRLSAKISRKLGPLFSGHLQPKPIAGQTTPSIEAYDHYVKGRICAETPAHGVDCSKELRTALELDPNFAQAAYELAIWLTWNGGALAEQRSLIERAERLADKAPDHDKTLIHAWAAHLEGNDTAALNLLRQATSESPHDKRAFYQAGDIHRHRDELTESISFFEEAIRLDPEYSWALGDLARVLGALNRTADLRKWAARWREAAGTGSLHGLSIARGWLGDVEGAAQAAQEAALMGAGVSAQEDLLTAKLFAGDYRMVEAGARMLTARPSSMRRLAYYGLAALEGYQGRPRAGLARLDELAREIPEVKEDSLYLTVRADFLVWLGNAGPVWTEVEQARRVDPRLAAEHAISLAYLGDLDHAEVLAKDLPAGTALARTYRALVSLRRGDRARGLSELRAVSADAPVVSWRMSPLFIYGEELAKAGRDAEAAEVLRRAQRLYVPAAMWRSWAYPRSRYLLANALHRMGRDDEARPVIERLLADWAHSETDAPQVREARRLAAHLKPE
jgi:eukaryotic-like serine/threonine-protein kinase